MRLDNDILYMPCPCGSGKKFKFCCFPECQGKLDGSMTRAEVVKEVRCIKAGTYEATNPKARELCTKGHEAFLDFEFDEARDLFRRARELNPNEVQAWNNGASCEWETGNVEAALELQRKGIENAPFRNTFGLAAMAIFLHVLGRDGEAAECIERALADRLPLGRDVVVRVCYALALYRRHRDIVDYASASGVDDDGQVAFFKATALANLGETERALPPMRTAAAGPFAIAEHYESCLEEGYLPRSVRENEWPYFSSPFFPPARWFDEDIDAGRDPFRHPAVAVEAIETLVNDCRRTPAELLALVKDRPGEEMAELRKRLEWLAKEDAAENAATSLPPGVTEAKDPARDATFKEVPKWRLQLDLREIETPEDAARRVFDGFLRPYFDRHCNFSPNSKDDARNVAIVHSIWEKDPDLFWSPSVTLVHYDQLWHAFLGQLAEYFENVEEESCSCEVRCDPMFGGPILSLKAGSTKESFMLAIADRFEAGKGHGNN